MVGIIAPMMIGVKAASFKIATIPDTCKGYCATTYIGGRTEDKIRKQEELVTVLDFTSMYPTMCILMKLWEFIICDHIEAEECTESAKQFLNYITIQDLQDPATWAKMNVIVETQPNEDILPTRGHYGDTHSWNIALNYITSDRKIWWALPDVINSKLHTGLVPKITRAIRYIPVGRQTGLKKVKIFGKELDPYKDNLFKWLIEYRLDLQHHQYLTKDPIERELLDTKQKGIKTIANATSYGIYMQIDTEDEECDVTVHGLSSFECRNIPKKEKLAEFYNPVIATLITAGARLILGTVERILVNKDAVHAYCDTDSMMVPPQFEKEIQAFFQPLNPYTRESVNMFKVDKYKDETGKNHELRNVWFFGLSSKMYVIYRKDGPDGKISVLKASSHGLKHLMSPFGSDSLSNDDNDTDIIDPKRVSWHKDVWLDILMYHHGKMTIEDLNQKYGHSYAIAKLAITTPNVMHRFDKINKDKPYSDKVKPVNFCLVGVGNFVDAETNKTVRPLAPFRKDAQRVAYEDFIDYNTDNTLRGCHYWKKFVSIFWDYVNHRESKFVGEKGILERRHITVSSVVHIGKESNNLDKTDVMGLLGDETLVYSSDKRLLIDNCERILKTKAREVRSFGIMQRTWLYIQAAVRSGRIPKIKAKTMKKMAEFLQS